MFEKFGLKKEGEDESKNAMNLVNAISKCFKENKVTIEPWQQKYYAMEFRGDDDKTLFKAFLKDD